MLANQKQLMFPFLLFSHISMLPDHTPCTPHTNVQAQGMYAIVVDHYIYPKLIHRLPLFIEKVPVYSHVN